MSSDEQEARLVWFDALRPKRAATEPEHLCISAITLQLAQQGGSEPATSANHHGQTATACYR